MLYQTSRHLWLQPQNDRVLVHNVCTGRRAILEPDDLPCMEKYTQPSAFDDTPLVRRLIAADIIVEAGTPDVESERAQAVLFALDKFLGQQRGLSRKRLIQEWPDPDQRLLACRDIVVPMLLEAPMATRILSFRHISEDFASTIDHVRTFLQVDALDGGAYAFSPGFLSSTAGRPLARRDYEQQPCLPHTTQERCRLAQGSLPADGRCLILGDDDLLSLYWSQHLSQAADVFELDDQLLAFLEPRLAPHVSLRQRDLTNGLPQEFHGQYDCIFTDPMYEARGMALFIKCCRQGLSERPGARVYFSTRPDLIQMGERLYAQFASAGLRIVRHHRNFNRYPFIDTVRSNISRDFRTAKAPAHLIDGLLNAPFLYADLFELERS